MEAEKSTKSNIKKNYFYNMMAKLIMLLVPILVTPYLSRKLGADGNGRLSYIASIVSYFVLLANIGIETYGQRIIAVHQNDKGYLKKITLEIGILRILLTIFSLALYYVIFVIIYQKNQVLYTLYGITLLMTAFDFSWFFQGIEDFKILALSNMISRIAYIPLIFIMVHDQSDINIAAILTILSTAVPYVLCMPKMLAFFKGVKMPSKLHPFDHFKPCMVYFIPTIAIQIYTVLDKTMIGLITKSDFENGYYEQAEKIVKLPLTVITSLNIVMRSRISYYYSMGRIGDIKLLMNKSCHFTMCMSIPICLGLCAVASNFIPIYLGEGYEKCITLLYVFSPIIIIISLSNFLGTHYYTPFDLQKTSNRFLIIGALINLVLNSFLIYFLKSIGAAIASVVAEGVITCLYIYFSRKIFEPINFIKIGYKYIISGLFMFAAVFIFNTLWLYSDFSKFKAISYLVLEIGIGIIIYFGLLYILKDSFVFDSTKKVLNKLKRR